MLKRVSPSRPRSGGATARARRQGDVAERPLWELPFVTDAERVTVERREPWAVRVGAPTAADPVAVLLDADAAVERVTTRP